MPEYKRTFGGGDQDGDAPARAAVERTFASVFYNNERNAARTLIAEGLATVARHGQADERSTMYAAQFWRNSGAIRRTSLTPCLLRSRRASTRRR